MSDIRMPDIDNCLSCQNIVGTLKGGLGDDYDAEKFLVANVVR